MRYLPVALFVALAGCSTVPIAAPPPPTEGIISVTVEAFGME